MNGVPSVALDRVLAHAEKAAPDEPGAEGTPLFSFVDSAANQPANGRGAAAARGVTIQLNPARLVLHKLHLRSLLQQRRHVQRKWCIAETAAQLLQARDQAV